MKFVSFQAPGGAASYGLVEGNEVIDLGATRPAAPTLKDFLATSEFQSGKVGTVGPRHPLSSVRLLPVVPNPARSSASVSTTKTTSRRPAAPTAPIPCCSCAPRARRPATCSRW